MAIGVTTTIERQQQQQQQNQDQPPLSIKEQHNNLYIPYVAPEMAGNYTCIVENEAGQRNFSYALNVLSPPQILDNDDYIENDILLPDVKTIEMAVKSGEQFYLECLAHGNPEPQVMFYIVFSFLNIYSFSLVEHYIYSSYISSTQKKIINV